MCPELCRPELIPVPQILWLWLRQEAQETNVSYRRTVVLPPGRIVLNWDNPF